MVNARHNSRCGFTKEASLNLLILSLSPMWFTLNLSILRLTI